MGIAVLIFFYGSALFCLIALAVMLTRYITAPVHLHWELYRESSVYELPDWKTKPVRSVGSKFISAFLDVIFLRDYYRRNRAFWYPLEIFHLGLFSLILWHVWAFATAALIKDEAGFGWGITWGTVSAGLVFIGAVVILIMRMTNSNLKVYYPPIHYIKWAFVIISLAGGFYAVNYYMGGSIVTLLAYLKHQLEFNLASKVNAPVATSLHLLIIVPWLIYIPFSHIMKVFFRYYHFLRWDEKPNLPGGDIETRVKGYLNKKVGWSAPHIQTGKTWGEVATTIPGDKSEAKKTK